MNVLKTAFLAAAFFFAAQASASAQATAPAVGASAASPLFDLRTVGAGLVVIGGAMGIGMLAKAAVESQARQPEMAGRIQTTMIIAAALIEGFTFFALAIIFIAVNQGK